MKKLIAGVTGLVAAILLGAVLLRGSPVEDAGATGGARGTAASQPAAKGSLAPDAVLAIAPRARGAPAVSLRPLPPLLQEFYSAKTYGALYARLKASTSRTPEEQWMLAEILARCAKVTDDESSRSARARLGSPESRSRFVASLAPNDPDRERRIAAFDQVNFDECQGLAGVETSRKEIRALLEQGAAGGDPKARAALVLEDLEDQLRGPDGKQKPGFIPRLGDDQVETLKQVMASGDPQAIRAAMLLLVGEYQNFSLRDADDRPLDRIALLRASTLLNCEYGVPCGPDAQWLLYACAMSGQCAANSLRDYMMYYASSPSASQVMAGYEAALRNARNNDWSFFHFYPAPLPSTAAFQPPGPP